MTDATLHPFFVAILLGAYLAACASTGPVGGERTGGSGKFSWPSTTRIVAPLDLYKTDGSLYEHPFLGGFNVPRPQLADIDGDGDPDLFIQEHTGSLMYFEHTGTPGAPSYEWRSDKYMGIDIGEWYRFADLDMDGDLDLLAEHPYSYIRYYQNTGTPQHPEFVQVGDSLRDVHGNRSSPTAKTFPTPTTSTATAWSICSSGGSTARSPGMKRWEPIRCPPSNS